MKENSFEANKEKILTREQVMEAMNRFAERSVFVRELSDEKGIYFYESKIQGPKEGTFIEYQYTRKGEFPNNIASKVTIIHAILYEDGIPYQGVNLAEYDEGTGKWEGVK